jgi:hypothetical protein
MTLAASGSPRGLRRALVAAPVARSARGIGPMATRARPPPGPDRGQAVPASGRRRGVEDRSRLKGVSPAGKDLTVLAPPLLVCAAFVIAVGAFLRHEMGASRRRRDQDASDDISGDGTIPDTASSHASTQSDDEDASGAD